VKQICGQKVTGQVHSIT